MLQNRLSGQFHPIWSYHMIQNKLYQSLILKGMVSDPSEIPLKPKGGF